MAGTLIMAAVAIGSAMKQSHDARKAAKKQEKQQERAEKEQRALDALARQQEAKAKENQVKVELGDDIEDEAIIGRRSRGRKTVAQAGGTDTGGASTGLRVG